MTDTEQELPSEQERQFLLRKLEEQYISLFFDYPEYWEAVAPHILPDDFQAMPHKYVITELFRLWQEHAKVPTRELIRATLARTLTSDDPHQEIFAAINRESDHREIPYLQKQLTTFVKQIAWNRLYSDEAIKASTTGDFKLLRELVAKADAVETISLEGEAYGFVGADELLKREDKTTWIVEDVLVQGQPCLVGGPKKALKTGILCDLAVSLATGTNFLGKFHIARPHKVAFFSCESGEEDIRDRIRTIREARGADEGLLQNLRCSFQRPKLSDVTHLVRVEQFIAKNEIEVLIVDPLYLTLLTGNKDASASNLFDMGRIYAPIADLCARCKATVILCHHFKKGASKELDLDDLTFAGSAEFARQSILIRRDSPYTGPTNNDLQIRFHGYRRGDLFSAHINEGTRNEPTWKVELVRTFEQEQNEAKSKENQDCNQLLDILAEFPDGTTQTNLRKAMNTNTERIKRLLEQVVLEGSVIKQMAGCYQIYKLAQPVELAS